MIKTLGLIGGPATGKSQLVYRFIESGMKQGAVAPHAEIRQHGLLKMTVFGSDLYVIGVYDGQRFPGTDRLGYTAGEHLDSWYGSIENGLVLWEGDRFAAGKYIEVMQKYSTLTLFHVTCQADVLARRRLHRRQQVSWAKGRDTKSARLARRYGAEAVDNSRPQDIETTASRLLDLFT